MTATSVPRLVRSWSRRYGPKTVLALHEGTGCVEFSWLDLWAEASRVAVDLVSAGLPDEGSVVIASPLSPASIMAEVGVMAARGVACPIDPSWDDDAMAKVLEQAAPWAVMVAEDQRERIERHGQRAPAPFRLLPLPAPRPGHATHQNPVPEVEARMESTGPGGHAVSLRAGEGDKPNRLVDFLHRTLTETAGAVAAAVGASEEDTWLIGGEPTSPFLRVAGLYAALVSGGQVAIVRRPDQADPLEPFWVARPTVAVLTGQEATALAARVREEARSLAGFWGWLVRVALRLEGILEPGDSLLPNRPWWREAARMGRARLSELLGGRLRVVLTGQGAPGPESARVFCATGSALCRAFGPPEAAGVITLERPGEALSGDTVGRPLDGVEVRAADDGEIWVRGHPVMLSYRMVRPDQNPLFVDGWMRTGLRGFVEATGLVRLAGEGRDGGEPGPTEGGAKR